MTFDALRFLKYVLAAAELGSMRRVARAFEVNESTVSRNIGALEQQLDIQLFERHNSGIRLTEEGRAWIRSVRKHYDGLEETLAQSVRQNRKSGTLRIGLSTPFGQQFLVRLIDRFEKAYPKIEVTIQDGSCRNQVTAIRRRRLDIAFVCADCDERACQSETVWNEGVAALLPADHSLAGKAALTWADLAGERLLVPQGADGPLLDPCLARQITAGKEPPVIEQCQACQATVIIKIQIGRGFTITGESFAKGINIQGTVWRPIIGPDTIGAVKAVWLDSNPKRAVLRLLGIARNMAGQLDQRSS